MSKKINNIHTYYKAELKLSQFAENIIYVENSKQSTKTLLELISDFGKVVGCKIKHKKQSRFYILNMNMWKLK